MTQKHDRLHLLISVALALPLNIAAHSAGADDQPVRLENIIEAWKAREQKIASFDFRWWSKHFESQPNDALTPSGEAKPPPRPDTTFIIMRRFASDKKDGQLRTRFDERGREWWPSRADFIPVSTVELLDHAVEKRFHPESPLGYPTLTTQGQVGLIDYHDIRSRPLRLIYRPLHSPIGVFPGQMTLGKETGAAESESLVVLEHPDAKVWVDPSKDFLPVRYTKGGANSLHSELEISYSRDETLGWVPQSWTNRQFDTTGKEYASDTAKVIEYSINKPLADSVFELSLPVGTHVTDATTDEEFVIRDGGRRERVSPKELNADNFPGFFLIDLPAGN